jgi:hypothetical protein
VTRSCFAAVVLALALLACVGEAEPPKAPEKPAKPSEVKKEKPGEKPPLAWSSPRLQEKWGIKVKGATLTNRECRLVLEFERDLKDEEQVALRTSFKAPRGSTPELTMRAYLFDGDGVAVSTAHVSLASLITGSKGDSFRVVVFSGAGSYARGELRVEKPEVPPSRPKGKKKGKR